MSIQRWTFDGPPAYPYENGGYVAYADHVAALLTQDRQHMEQQQVVVEAARTQDAAVLAAFREHEGCDAAGLEEGYDKGRADAAADVAAAPILIWGHDEFDVVDRDAAVAAARGEEKR